MSEENATSPAMQRVREELERKKRKHCSGSVSPFLWEY